MIKSLISHFPHLITPTAQLASSDRVARRKRKREERKGESSRISRVNSVPYRGCNFKYTSRGCIALTVKSILLAVVYGGIICIEELGGDSHRTGCERGSEQRG